MTKKTKDDTDCFVIMPLSVPKNLLETKAYEKEDHFKRVYEEIIKPAIEGNGWKPIFPNIQGSQIIIKEIIESLFKSEMVVCDISIYNPNVFYEAGIRTALDKPIAYIKDDSIEKIPFDTVGLKHETYRKELISYEVREDIKLLERHFKNTYEKSEGKNPTWKSYGLQIKAEQPSVEENVTDARIELLMNKMENIEYLIKSTPSTTVLTDKQMIFGDTAQRIAQFFYFLKGENLDKGIDTYEPSVLGDNLVVLYSKYPLPLERKMRIELEAQKFGLAVTFSRTLPI